MFMLYDDAEINRIALRDAEKNAVKKIVFRMLKNNKSDEDIIADVDISIEELDKFKTEYTNAQKLRSEVEDIMFILYDDEVKFHGIQVSHDTRTKYLSCQEEYR